MVPQICLRLPKISGHGGNFNCLCHVFKIARKSPYSRATLNENYSKGIFQKLHNLVTRHQKMVPKAVGGWAST